MRGFLRPTNYLGGSSGGSGTDAAARAKIDALAKPIGTTVAAGGNVITPDGKIYTNPTTGDLVTSAAMTGFTEADISTPTVVDEIVFLAADLVGAANAGEKFGINTNNFDEFYVNSVTGMWVKIADLQARNYTPTTALEILPAGGRGVDFRAVLGVSSYFIQGTPATVRYIDVANGGVSLGNMSFWSVANTGTVAVPLGFTGSWARDDGAAGRPSDILVPAGKTLFFMSYGVLTGKPIMIPLVSQVDAVTKADLTAINDLVEPINTIADSDASTAKLIYADGSGDLTEGLWRREVSGARNYIG